MPELPEVEHIRRYLAPRLDGRRIVRVSHFDWPPALRGPRTLAGLARALRGTRIAAAERLGKLVALRLDDGRTLLFHLKMTGKLWVEDAPRAPGRDVRAIFELEGGRALVFEDQRKFGWVAVASPGARERLAAALGPDALRAEPAEIAARYAARRGRLKPILLDQRVVAGVGNIYADEVLHAARLHPARRMETLSRSEIERLARATRDVIEAAVARREGEDVPDQKRVGAGRRGVAARLGPRVYQRTGEPCGRCGEAIERIVLAGRATHLCPRCQPAPRVPINRSRG